MRIEITATADPIRVAQLRTVFAEILAQKPQLAQAETNRTEGDAAVGRVAACAGPANDLDIETAA